MSYGGYYDYTYNYQEYSPAYGAQSYYAPPVSPPLPPQYTEQYNVIATVQQGNESFNNYFSNSIIDTYA